MAENPNPQGRLLLAFILSALVLFVWNVFVMPGSREPSRPPESGTAGETPVVSPVRAKAIVAARIDTPPRTDVSLRTADLEIGASREGGVLTHLALLGFRRHGGNGAADPVEMVGSEVETAPRLWPLALIADTPDLGNLGRAAYEIEASETGWTARLAAAAPLLGALRVEKRLALDTAGHHLRFAVRIANPTETPASLSAARIAYPDGTRRSGSLLLHWSDLGRNEPPPLWRDQVVVTARYGDAAGKPRAVSLEPGFLASLWGPPAPPVEISWAALENRYFAAAFVPRFPGLAAHFERENGAVRMYLVLPPVDLPPGGAAEFAFDVHAGPKSTEALTAVDPRLRPLDGMEPSILPVSLARPTVRILRAIERVTGNYGWAIIVITILVRIALLPLTIASIRQMERMKALAPKIEEVKAKYADDKERLNREMLKVYAEGGANPLGGCLPIILQIPVFIALYQCLQWSVDLRGAPFILWIRDLSAPDTLFTIAGFPVNILPLVMGGTMLWQQKISTPPGTDPQQAQMMRIMSILMTVMFWTFPSGLNLYWTIQNALAIVQQYVMMARSAPAPAR